MTKLEKVAKMYFNSRKKLEVPEGTELANQVKEIEEEINKKMTIWDDEDTFFKFSKINRLSLEERRLMIVFVILDCSINRVASLFQVDRKTISNRLDDIKRKVNKME